MFLPSQLRYFPSTLQLRTELNKAKGNKNEKFNAKNRQSYAPTHTRHAFGPRVTSRAARA